MKLINVNSNQWVNDIHFQSKVLHERISTIVASVQKQIDKMYIYFISGYQICIEWHVNRNARSIHTHTTRQQKPKGNIEFLKL